MKKWIIGGIVVVVIIIGLICSGKKKIVYQQFENCSCRCPLEK